MQIPKLTWGKEVKAPPKATNAELNINVISTNLNSPVIAVKNIASFSIQINPLKKTDVQPFEFDTTEENGWILVIGSISFNAPQNNIKPEQKGASTYLWTKSLMQLLKMML